MSKLRECLVRMGVEHLAGLLGAKSVRLLEMLSERSVTATSLSDLVLSQFGPEYLLFDKTARGEILQALNTEDALRLSRLLGFEAPDDPFVTLAGVEFRKGTLPFRLLLSFFGVVLSDDDAADLPDSTCVVSPDYPLFDHQRRAGREVYTHLTSSTPPRVLLHMPTGAGKTRTAMHFISLFLRHRALDNEVVIWLAHTEELCEQAAEEFSKAWARIGDRHVNLFRHFGTMADWLKGKGVLPDQGQEERKRYLQTLVRWLLHFIPGRYRLEEPNYSELFGRVEGWNAPR